MIAAGFGAVAAPAPTVAQPVVQPLPSPAAAGLNAALRRLSGNPRSLEALLEAGRASLELDDVEAAAGFFARAEAIAPSDGRVLTGLARVALAEFEAVSALLLFDRAAAAGEPLGAHAAERGLAYDLVGLNARAQGLYGEALAREEDAEVLRRLALSYAIAGDHEAAEATLLPLLQTQDLAAFRARAFALAISGRAEEAVAIAEAMLPARLAQRIAPYLRYMPRLTRAQQAAAANLGQFPLPSEIGIDPPEIAAFTAGEPAPPSARPQGADSRLIPGGEALGPALAQPTVPVIVLPPVEQEAAPAGADTGAQSAATPPPEGVPVPPPSEGPLANGPTPAAPQPRIDLTEVFPDFERTSPPPTGPRSADAVDIARITPAPEPPPPAAPAEPSRQWVQVATGQDTAAFGWDWRRIVRAAGGLLDGREAFHAPWGASNRLVTGPFASQREAQELVSRLAANGVSSFVFTSADGERIAPLP